MSCQPSCTPACFTPPTEWSSGLFTLLPWSVDNIAALRSVTENLLPGALVQVLGYWEKNDGGGGFFAYDATSVAVDNAGTIVAPNSGVGRWIRQFNGDLNARWFGAIGDGSRDVTQYLQATFNFGVSTNTDVYIPSGNYVVSSTLLLSLSSFNKSFSLYGDNGNTVLAATHFSGAVLEIQTGSQWDTSWTKVSGLHITGAVLYNTPFAGMTGVYHNASSGLRMSDVYVSGVELGFRLRITQFSEFSALSGCRCTVGMYLTPGSTINDGGGNSNTFSDCWFSANKVGVILNNPGFYPFGPNKFVNLVTNVNEVCAVYLGANGSNGPMATAIESWVPEANGTGAATFNYDGITIKNGILHAVHGQVVLRDYVNASNTNKLIGENYSTITIDGGQGAALLPETDSTSLFGFTETPYGHYYASVGSIVVQPPMFIANGQQSTILAVPNLTPAPWLENQFLTTMGRNVTIGEAGPGTNCQTSYVTDSEMGYVLQLNWPNSTESAVFYPKNGSYVSGDRIAVSFLIKSSSSSAKWAFNLAQSTAYSQIQIPADRWVRVVIYGKLLAASAFTYMTVECVSGTAGATLKIGRFHSVLNLPPNTLARFVHDGLFNAGPAVQSPLYLPSAPTTGTWAQGDVVWNSSPSSGGYVGWTCTAAGTPGTWKTFGPIS